LIPRKIDYAGPKHGGPRPALRKRAGEGASLIGKLLRIPRYFTVGREAFRSTSVPALAKMKRSSSVRDLLIRTIVL
jgi:hypothetical protein